MVYNFYMLARKIIITNNPVKEVKLRWDINKIGALWLRFSVIKEKYYGKNR